MSPTSSFLLPPPFFPFLGRVPRTWIAYQILSPCLLPRLLLPVPVGHLLMSHPTWNTPSMKID